MKTKTNLSISGSLLILSGGLALAGRKITLKYEGRCVKCGKTIPMGTEAYWESGKGVWHLGCVSAATQRPAYFSKTIVALTAVLVVSALVLGYSLGRFGGYQSYQPPVTVLRTVTVTTSEATSPVTTPSVTTPRKWISPDAISYLDAKKYVGQVKTVEGKIVRTYRYEPGNVIFLNFHDPYEGYFTVIVWRENWKNFPFAPEVFYKGKEVRVTGLIKDYQGTPQIEATSPKQIEVAYMGFDYAFAPSRILATIIRKTRA